MSKHQFQTEVNQLLELIIHSLYSHKEIFLRELVSNASDALDKLKFLTLSDDKFKSFPFDPHIDIHVDSQDKKLLTIEDTGIGMNDEDLVENLGTIARSGTKNFLQKMTGDSKKDSNLIGQFGVGFYSAFMIASQIEVISKKAGEDKAFKWTSDGTNSYTIEPAEREANGTTVILHLNDEGEEYSNKWDIENLIKKYSNHISFPINIHYESVEYEGEGDDKKEKRVQKVEKVNEATALWKQPKSELKDEDYNEFYKSMTYDSDEPLLHLHTQAEGSIEYTTLFYVPKKAPWDIFYTDYQPGVKLYVKRVFITDKERDLIPSYLRFIRGIIDSEDLPLNISREILQQNRTLMKIKQDSVKRILGSFTDLAKNDPEKYEEFHNEYGKLLREGLYQDHANRETLLELVRYKSTKSDKPTSMADYKNRMKEDQKAIYYITGEDEEVLRSSPLLEAYNKNDIEVLIMDDKIDELVTPVIAKYGDIELRSVNRSDAAKDLKTDDDTKKAEEIKPLIERIKEVLKDDVKDVKASVRLSDSPACIVADENDPTVQMQHILEAMGQGSKNTIKPILEINPDHIIIKKLESVQDIALFEDTCRLLLEQSLLIEGAKLKNPALFARRLNDIMSKAL